VKSDASITRRLTLAVLFIELVAALVLIAIVGNHERHVQFNLFESNLRGGANAIFGALQESDTAHGDIALDRDGLSIPERAVYRVSDEEGTVLGTQGQAPVVTVPPGSFVESRIGRESYLFYVMTGERVIDPGKPFAVDHHVQLIYGLPVGRVWHEIVEAIRFFAIATLLLLGITAFLLTWLTRRLLQPIHRLAIEAGKINTDSWEFNAPASSSRLVELRPLVAAIEKSVARLQRSFEQQRRFTSDAAHELKTDLAIVKSSLQVLSMKRRTVDEYEEGLSLGLDDIGRLEATVQKMLTLARLEQTPGKEQQSCDFAAAVVESIAQSQPFAELKQVTVAQNISEWGGMVSLSREDALLLCSNVLMNALQYSPSQEEIEITVNHEQESVFLRVWDHGAGVTKEDQPFLFDAFYRGDASRSRKTGGTGLGLSICKAICDRAGGSISITNHPEGGALVEIELPAARSNYLQT
jgi:signal transduction histidine kinase